MPELLLEQVDGVERHHQRRAMGEVDDVQHAVDQRQPQRHQRIDRAGGQAVEDGGNRMPKSSMGGSGPASRTQREHRVGLAVLARHDHPDVALDHLRHQRLGARCSGR